MPTAKNEVKLKFGDKAKYASAIKNADTVYFITVDTFVNSKRGVFSMSAVIKRL